MKKLMAKLILTATMMGPLAMVSPLPVGAVAPTWDVTGAYVVNMNYLGTDYAHDMALTQDNTGNLTGNGGSPAGANTYTWVITSGTVSANTIDFYANYTATPDAVTPQTVLHVLGTVANDGTLSGTWSDNYQGNTRSGTWMSTSGNAIEFPSMVTVTIAKYIDGSMATAISAKAMDFPMTSSWTADNLGSGSGSYTLGPIGFNSANPYEAKTSDMSPGASYTTSETTGGPVVAENCDADQPYALMGYTSGNTASQAQSASPTMTAPSFADMNSSKYVIVWNKNCDTDGDDGSIDDGQIGGDVEEDNGVLKVDSITVVDSSATANGSFADGWKYIFHITTPNDEENLAMKFADWVSGSNTIPVANNMRISSAQANNGGATILLTAANTYSTPPLVMVSDLNGSMAGRQVEVTVEVSVPSGTPSGSYTTTYGVQTTP